MTKIIFFLKNLFLFGRNKKRDNHFFKSETNSLIAERLFGYIQERDFTAIETKQIIVPAFIIPVHRFPRIVVPLPIVIT